MKILIAVFLFLSVICHAQQIEVVPIQFDTTFNLRQRFFGAGSSLVGYKVVPGSTRGLLIECFDLENAVVDSFTQKFHDLPGSIGNTSLFNMKNYSDTLYSTLFYSFNFDSVPSPYPSPLSFFLQVSEGCQVDTTHIKTNVEIQLGTFASPRVAYYVKDGMMIKSFNFFDERGDSLSISDYHYVSVNGEVTRIENTDYRFLARDVWIEDEVVYQVDGMSFSILGPGAPREYSLPLFPVRPDSVGYNSGDGDQVFVFDNSIYLLSDLDVYEGRLLNERVAQLPYVEKRNLDFQKEKRVSHFYDELNGTRNFKSGRNAFATIDEEGNITRVGISLEQQRLYAARVDKDLNILFEYSFPVDTYFEIQALLPSNDPSEFYVQVVLPYFIGGQEFFIPKVYHIFDLENASSAQEIINVGNQKALTLFPNPCTTGDLFISDINVSQKGFKNCSYVLWSSAGKPIRGGEVFANGGLDVSDLLTGTYFLELFGEGYERLGSGKFIVN